MTTARTTNGIQSRQRAHQVNEEDSDAEDSDADGGAKRGRVTAHYIVQRSSGLEEHDDRRKSPAEKTWARRSLVAHRRVRLWRGELRSGAWARARGQVGEEHARVRRGQHQRRWHRGTKDVLLSDSARGGMTRRYGLRRWLGITPKRPALCLRGLQKVIARECEDAEITNFHDGT